MVEKQRGGFPQRISTVDTDQSRKSDLVQNEAMIFTKLLAYGPDGDHDFFAWIFERLVLVISVAEPPQESTGSRRQAVARGHSIGMVSIAPKRRSMMEDDEHLLPAQKQSQVRFCSSPSGPLPLSLSGVGWDVIAGMTTLLDLYPFHSRFP